MKICYFINSINYKGGIERTTIVKANYWAKTGHDVFIAVTDHNPKVPPIEPLNENVQLINLDVNYYTNESNSLLSKLKNIYHLIKIQKFVNAHKPDVLISVGQSEKYLIPLIKTSAIKIREIHYFSKYRILTYSNQLLANILNFLDFKVNIIGFNKYVLLTNEDYNFYWKGNKNKTSVISNPLTIPPIISPLTSKVCVCVCRLNNTQKNINELIQAFAIVSKKHPDWELKIYGDGPDKDKIQQLINNLELTNVFLEGYTNNIPKVLSNADIYISTSNYEGQPLSIIEALSCGLPVVTYQFPVGSKDILEDSGAGYLVPMHNTEMLANKICDLIEDENLIKTMSKNAIKRAEDFRIDNIMKRWLDLFNSLIRNV